MNVDDITQAAVAELQAKHGCHTVILYGSRAVGSETEASDYDLAGFGDLPTTVRVARVWRERYLDLFAYPDSCLADPPFELLKLRSGVVLVEKDGFGAALLARLEERFAAGPEKLPADELDARRVWAGKMVERARRGDLEGDYRRVWLLTALLEDYFHLRGLWYLGPKAAFAWLREHDLTTHAAFEDALRPQAGIESIASLVGRVTSEVRR